MSSGGNGSVADAHERPLTGAQVFLIGTPTPPGRDRLLLFRVVGYLPGERARPSCQRELRAGVAQASREETAAEATVVVQGAEAMVIWAPTFRARSRQAW